jgi:peroxiredoxin Q/BCP
VVLGVSFNTVGENAAFAAKYGFGFKLLCDTTHGVAAAYGACVDIKARYPERMSFLIDADGRVERVYDRVDPRDHAARVLADVLGI